MTEELLLPHKLPEQSRPHRVCGLHTIPAGKSQCIALMRNTPGCIRHFFLTLPPRRLREIVLRIWWDDEEEPSVEVPLNDFFGIGHDLATAELSCPWFYIAPRYGYNCYLPMPFGSSCRAELENQGAEDMPGVNVMIGWESYSEPLDCAWRLHAAFRRVMPAYRRGEGLTLVEAGPG